MDEQRGGPTWPPHAALGESDRPIFLEEVVVV